MLKKLRIKFVAIIMASVAVVLAVVFTGICVSEYQRSMNNVNEALSSSLDRAVQSMEMQQIPFEFDERDDLTGFESRDDSWRFEGVEGEAGDARYGDALNSNGMSNQGQFGPRIGGRDEGDRSLVPVGVYSIDGSGSLTVVSEFTTGVIGDDVIDSVAAIVIAADEGSGEITDLGLMYQKRVTETMTYVAFADSSYASSWQSLALTLVVAAIVVLAVFFVIALLLSRWALRPVEEAWTAQRQFVADASHELKTPLTVILANNSILLKHSQESVASQSQWVESTQVEAENMQGLVNEMLELAQVESRSNIAHEPFDFSDLVNEQVLQFESVAFERGCVFEESIADGITVNGDAQRLRKMASTLIENALKYVDEGGTVAVELDKQAREARLSIRNTGSTISAEDLPHIFDRFYRTDKARTSGAGGYGLGLAIAREIAREHDGDIVCESDASGTTFVVTLSLM